MEKKILIWPIILGSGFIIVGSMWLFIFRYGLFYPDMASLWSNIVITAPSVCHIIMGFGILRHKNWSRSFSFVLLPIGLILTFVYLWIGGFALYPQYAMAYLLMFNIGLYWILAIISFIYFNLSKVKEQFK